MTNRRALELLMIERSCVRKGSGMMLDPDIGYIKIDEDCNRDCANCPLVQDSRELLDMYDKVITMMLKKVEEEDKVKELKDWQVECKYGPLERLAI